MLVLTRRIGEQIVIDGVISVTVVAIKGDKVRLGISAPPSVRVDRSEIHERRLAVPRPSVSSRLEGVTLMRIAQQGDCVQVHYVKRLRDGRKAFSREPLQLTVGIDHPRLPGLGAALVGLTVGQLRTLTVPPEQAYGVADPTRIHRWSRRRFPSDATLQAGKLIRFTDEQGRRHRVRILEANSKMVVVDANHPWAGQTLELEVQLLAFLEPPLGPEEATASSNDEAPNQSVENTMPTKEQGPQQAELAKRTHEQRSSVIVGQLLQALGRPATLYRVEVRHLWDDHYRANVFVGADVASTRVAHSFSRSWQSLATRPMYERCTCPSCKSWG